MVFAIFYQIFSQESVIILEKLKVTERTLEKIMDASGTSKTCIEKNTGQSNSVLVFWWGYTVWKFPKYGYFSDPYFPVFSPNTGKYGPEKTPYFGHFSRSVNDCIGYEYENEETHQLACRFPPRSITLEQVLYLIEILTTLAPLNISYRDLLCFCLIIYPTRASSVWLCFLQKLVEKSNDLWQTDATLLNSITVTNFIF